MARAFSPHLQWGRVLWDAERPEHQTEHDYHLPFNGAASCGTRKELYARLPPPKSAPFNGAASCGTRKARRRRNPGRPPSSFNGAASCGTRKADRSIVRRGLLIDLQWGRVLWDAERAKLPLAGDRCLWPSMGPRLVGRGKDPVDTGSAGSGSPSMGPRLVGRGKPVSTHSARAKSWALQWGRVLWDAESAGGPRPPNRYVPLQWGRVLWDAERWPIALLHLGWVILQWGRVLWDAESLVPVPQGYRAHKPSMGPRLVGRGKDKIVGHERQGYDPSMGPRLVGRGKRRTFR